MRLRGKVALITGAAKGIGKATALLYAREGARVGVADLDRPGGEDVVSRIRADGGEAVFTAGDVGMTDDAKRMVAETTEAFGGLNVLMNNAAIMAHGTVVDTPEELWDEVMRIDLKSIFLMSKHAIPEIVRSGGGSIINVASSAGLKGWYNQAAYHAAKAGVINLSRQMALDYIKRNIRVNCLIPALIDTAQLRGAIAQTKDPEAALATFVRRIPLGRLGTAEEIAYGALFLASDEASYVVGSPLLMDGGYMAG